MDHAFFEKNDTKLLCSLPALTKQAPCRRMLKYLWFRIANCDTYTDPSHFFSYRRDGIHGTDGKCNRLVVTFSLLIEVALSVIISATSRLSADNLGLV